MPGKRRDKSDVLPTVISSLLRGSNLTAAAGAAGISYSTLYCWMHEDEGVAIQIEQARYAAENAAACALFEIAMNGVRESDRVKALVEWLRRRAPERWSANVANRSEVETGLQTILAEVKPHMSAGSYAEIIKALATVAGLDQETTGFRGVPQH